MDSIFFPEWDAELAMAVLDRRDGTELDLVKRVAAACGSSNSLFTLAGLREMMLDQASVPPLKVVMNSTTGVYCKYKVKTMGERLDEAGAAPPPRPTPIEPSAPAGADGSTPLWVPHLPIPTPSTHFTWFHTIYMRVNAPSKLYDAYLRAKGQKDIVFQQKLKRFQEHHLPIVRYLDDLLFKHGVEAVMDNALDVDHILELYGEGLGPSKYECDPPKVTQSEEHVLKPTPMEMIEKMYPDLVWNPEEVAEKVRSGELRSPDLTPYIDGSWCPLVVDGSGVPPDPSTHSLYYGVVYVLNQTRECLEACVGGADASFPLWVYYCSFVDLFYHVLPLNRGMSDLFLTQPLGTTLSRDKKTFNYTDKASPWEMWVGCLGAAAPPQGTRTFVAGDLPDFYHVLNSIPLRGEQETPTFFLGKIYQKSLPFACHRRHLTRLVVDSIKVNQVFWNIFSKLAWVMFANLYPGELWTPFDEAGGCQGMRELLRIKELTENKQMIINAISINSKNDGDSGNGGPLVILTILRMHILYMASLNPQYVELAKKCIDWGQFKSGVLKLVSIIRSYDLFPADPFGQARKKLSKTVKSPNTKVHRLRKRSLAVVLSDQFDEVLKKHVLKLKQLFAQDLIKLKDRSKAAFDQTHVATKLLAAKGYVYSDALHTEALVVAQRAANYFKNLLYADTSYKSRIMNALVRIQPEVRMTRPAFNIMKDPEYGGMTEDCINLLCSLVVVYQEKALPREFRQRIMKMRMKDFVVACYYLNAVALLENISFRPHSAETIQRTDDAMVRRVYETTGGPSVPVLESMYNVSVALCCEKVCTLTGYGKHGNKKVTYNMEKQSFVCAHGKSMKKKKKQEEDAAAAAAAAAVAVVDDDDDSDKDGDDEEEEDDGRAVDLDLTGGILQAEDDNLDVENFEAALMNLGTADLTGDAAAPKGKDTKKARMKRDRKAIRNECKAFSKIPCGQPVLTFSLRDRALIWGNTLEKKTQIMFCPECGSLHVFTVLNFSASESGHYRCNECARKELMHVEYRACAYCNKSTTGQISEDTRLEIMCPDDKDGQVLKWHYFCKTHFRIARRSAHLVGKKDLWKIIKKEQEERNMQYVKGNFKGGRRR